MQAAYLRGRPPKSVNMYWRRFKTSSIPVNDPVAFEIWLRARWMEKDRLLEIFAQTGHFPADTEAGGSGYIETQVKAFRWYEFLQIFAPIGLFALVLYSFYGQLPKSFLASINQQITVAKNTAIQAIKGPEVQKRILTQGTRMMTNKSTVANQLVRARLPALHTISGSNGQSQLVKLNKPKLKALPPADAAQTSTSRKTIVKAPPVTPAKGKKNHPSMTAIKTKAPSSAGNQIAKQPNRLKPHPKPLKLNPATTSASPTIR